MGAEASSPGETPAPPTSKMALTSSLHQAVESGDLETVEKLLETSGQDVNYRDAGSSRKTLLMIAAREGHKDIVDFLIQKGADATLVGNGGWNAVLHASWQGHSRVLEKLLSSGGPLDVQEKKFGHTALAKAVLFKHPDCVSVLLEHGASLDVRGHDGKTAKELAVDKKHTDIVRLIEKDEKKRGELNYVKRET